MFPCSVLITRTSIMEVDMILLIRTTSFVDALN